MSSKNANGSPAARVRTGASPRVGVSSTNSGVASVATAGQADEKYLAYMKALRVGRQRAKAVADGSAGSSLSSPVRLTPAASPRSIVGQNSAVNPATPAGSTPGQIGQRGAAKGVPNAPSGAVLERRHRDGIPRGHVSVPAERPASPRSDSSDSIDFEVRSIGHVRSVRKTPTAASLGARASETTDEVALEVRDLHRFLHQSLSSASQEIAKTSGEQTMGKGEGVVVEADVGYKDGQAVFSPHGADQSHVEEDAQEKASKKIAELESMKAMIDQQRTPVGKGIEGSGSSRLSSVKDELKAQLSSIKAGLAQSFEKERESDDVGGTVRNKLRSLHEAISQDDDDESLKSPTSDGGQSAPRSLKREQLTAKLRSYQAQLRIAQSQGIARRLDESAGEEATWSKGAEETDKSSAAEARVAKLQSDIKEAVENSKKIEAARAAADGGSAGAISNPPLESSSKKGDSSPYAGVFPRSDDIEDVPTKGPSDTGTKRSAAKTGMAPASLDYKTPGDEPGEEFPAGPVDENDPVVLAGERLRQANSYAGAFAGLMISLAIISFFFGIFMPFGFSVWAIALPLGLSSGYFLRYCYPLPSSDGDSTMSPSLTWVSIVVVYVGASLFFAGILAASASLSIAPIIDTAVCTGAMPPPINVSTVQVDTKNGTNVTRSGNQGGGSLNATGNFTTAPTKTVTGNPAHPLSGLDAETLMKFGGCQAWNMCGEKGIKMLTCSQLKALNDWNAVFFFLTSVTIPLVWLWIYYVISVRLAENAAVQDGFFEVLDCSLPACYARFMENITASAPASEDVYGDEEEQHQGAPKFNEDGPYRTGSAGSARSNGQQGGSWVRGARV